MVWRHFSRFSKYYVAIRFTRRPELMVQPYLQCSQCWSRGSRELVVHKWFCPCEKQRSRRIHQSLATSRNDCYLMVWLHFSGFSKYHVAIRFTRRPQLMVQPYLQCSQCWSRGSRELVVHKWCCPCEKHRSRRIHQTLGTKRNDCSPLVWESSS